MVLYIFSSSLSEKIVFLIICLDYFGETKQIGYISYKNNRLELDV